MSRRGRASFITVFALAFVSTISPAPALGADAAPYTTEAQRKLDRAADRVERPRPAPDNPTLALKNIVAYFDAIYSKAGYSFDKSLQRYLAEYDPSGMSSLHPVAQPPTAIVAAMSQLPSSVRLEEVFKGETLRLATAVRKSLEQSAPAAKNQSTASAGVSARLLDGRYLAAPNATDRFVELRAESDTSVTLSAEHYAASSSGSALCRIPPVKIKLAPSADSEAAGEATVPGCLVQLSLNTRAEPFLVLRLNGGNGCRTLCATQGSATVNWPGGMYRSPDVSARFASRPGNAGSVAPSNQQRLQEELARRSGKPLTTAADDEDESPDAPRTEDNWFKKRR